MVRKRISCIAPLVLLFVFSKCQSNRYNFQFGLFNGTVVESLADAVKADDSAAIRRFATKHPTLIDVKESKFGQSLLFLAILNNKEAATWALLKSGASPNAIARDGGTPLIVLCTYPGGFAYPESLLQEMILRGANVNYRQVDTTADSSGHRKKFSTTPLRASLIYGKSSFVKILVDNGADYKSGKNEESFLATATLSMKLEAIDYLIKKGAPIPEYVVIRQPHGDHPKKMTMTDMLNEKSFKNEPDNERLKKQILNELASRGEK